MLQPKQIALALSAVFLTAGSAFAADDMTELKAQMKALMAQNAALTSKLEDMQKQIKTLDSNVGAVPKNFKVVTAGDEEGSFKLPGSDTSVSIYGYARLDAYTDLKGRQSGDWAADIGSQPLRGTTNDNRSGKTNLTARQSRFGIKTLTPTELGNLRTKIETDFVQDRSGGFTDNNYTSMVSSGYQLRLRHAYGELDGDWGKLLGGQTWSTFMNLDALPETIDFNGHGSAAFMRQAQLRYTAKLGIAGELALAMENPYGTGDPASASQTGLNIDKRPDLIANWTKTFSRGFVSAQFLNSEYRIQGNNIRDSRQGYGYGIGGAWKVTDANNLTLQITAGKGIGRYIPTTSYHIAALDANNHIQLYRTTSWVAGWAHTWSETIRTNLAYGETLIQDNYLKNLGAGGLDSRRMSEGFANVLWGIAKNTELGLEYSWGTRKTYGDNGNGGISYTGNRSRIQGSLQYSF